jgi:hypothetical protein
MSGNISGPGVGLPIPQNLYPSLLNNAPIDPSSNSVILEPGEVLVIPAGDWLIALGSYLVIQFLDPVSGIWTFAAGSAYTRGLTYVPSDGFTIRIANLTGCVVGAVVAAPGTSYVQATTTITAVGTFNNAAPTFLPIVGGQLSTTGTFTIDVPTKGAGYGVAPIIAIPPPPPAINNPNGVGGIPATAIAILGTGGSISSISMTNLGAGYPAAPTAVVVTSPFDPNINTGITVASVSFSLTGSGVLAGALCTNHGSNLNNGSLTSVTLSIGGAGSGASLSAIVMQTVVSSSITGAGSAGAFGTTSYGGVPATGSIVNPYSIGTSWIPRPLQASYPTATANQPATIYDGGLFLGAPTAAPFQSTGLSTISTVTLNMGSRPDTAIIQPGP